MFFPRGIVSPSQIIVICCSIRIPLPSLQEPDKTLAADAGDLTSCRHHKGREQLLLRSAPLCFAHADTERSVPDSGDNSRDLHTAD